MRQSRHLSEGDSQQQFELSIMLTSWAGHVDCLAVGEDSGIDLVYPGDTADLAEAKLQYTVDRLLDLVRAL